MKWKKPYEEKKWSILALVCFLILSFSGCGITEEKPGETAKASENTAGDKALQIGMSFDSFVIERWIRDRDVFVATAKELGAEVNVQNANGDVQEQIEQIRYLIEKGVDVLVIVAADCDALRDVVAQAHARKIPVISYDRLIRNAGTDLYLSFDNRKVGVLMAQALKEAIPEGGEIFMIQGSMDDFNVELVREGFEAEIEGSSLSVVYEASCEGWLAEQAIGYVNEALLMYPDVKGIMCGNDDIATQVIRVLAENRLADKVKVVGQDGDLAACQRIVEGTQTMTAFKSVEDLARLAAGCALKLAAREEIPESSNTAMNDGTKDIPCVFLDPVLVRKDNMKKIIVDGGYHSLNDVYLNVFAKSQ